jgi:hypothetical protein
MLIRTTPLSKPTAGKTTRKSDASSKYTESNRKTYRQTPKGNNKLHNLVLQ